MKPVFKARDDSEHTSAEAAERHNKLLDATETFRRAADMVCKYLGETAVTADGHPFDMSRSGFYWLVRKSLMGLPALGQVWIWPHNCYIETDDGRLVYRSYEHGGYVTYRISDLYVSERAARRAHIEACEQRIVEFQEEVAGLKTELKQKERRA